MNQLLSPFRSLSRSIFRFGWPRGPRSSENQREAAISDDQRIDSHGRSLGIFNL
jgi:hypothetical protein